MRVITLVAMVVVFAGSKALAQTTDDKAWSFSAVAYTYVVPDRNYVQPTFTADRGRLHLEGRYNNEALDTASAWGGYNFSGGEHIEWELTPIFGVVFGDLNGVSPGYRGSVGWWKLELYSEGEVVFDLGESSESFLYNWSELTLTPVDRFRFGLVTLRTRVYQTDRDIQRGLLAGFTYKKLDLSGYVFDPDDDPTYVFAVGLSF